MKLRNFLTVAMTFVLVSCTAQETTENAVIFYSQTGNTAKVAELFASQLGAEVIELKCVKPYPDSFQATIEESQQECMNSTGRALEIEKFDLSRFDTIFIGYPIWFGTYAPPIVTFARENELEGKNVVLFCTYGSGGRQASENSFKKMCPGANVISSFGVAARQVDSAADEVTAFIDGLRNPSQKMVGAFSESRELTEEDIAIFNTAMAEYGYLGLTPLSVATQVVAGMNYMFTCAGNGPDGSESTCQVLIYKPLQGDPVMKSVER